MAKGNVDSITRRLDGMITRALIKFDDPLVALNELPSKEKSAELTKKIKEVESLRKAATQSGVKTVKSMKTGKAKKIYRTNVDTIGLNVAQFGPQPAVGEELVDPRLLRKRGSSVVGKGGARG